MSIMNSDFAKLFSRNAELFPHLLNIPSDQILLSRLSEHDYKSASFLDQRIITPKLQRQTVTWSALADIPLPKRTAPNYIFHIGHVGSTLISRLLGEHPNVLALREPQILRDLAEISQIQHQPQSPWSPEQYTLRAKLAISWLSRTFSEQQRVMIKASSFVSEIAHELLDAENKALFLYVSLNKYLETILAGEGSRAEASQLAGARLLRLNKKLPPPNGASQNTHLGNLWELSHVQQIALGWLCEMSTLMQTYEQQEPSNIYWHDFDVFLNSPKSELVKIAEHFGLPMTSETADRLVSGPIMNSYSKAPEHDYSPDLRRQLLQQARTEFATEIKQTTNWVTGLAKTHPLIDTIVGFTNEGP